VKNSIHEYGVSSDLRIYESKEKEEKELKELFDPDLVYAKLLEKLLALWIEHIPFLVRSRGVFKRERIP
jgi:hypothetical protein